MSTLDASMDNARAYLPLTPQQFHILLALADGDRHGYGMILEIAERTGGVLRLGTGTLYTALARLVEDGLILESGRRPAASQDDARRRYYKLTAFGRAVLTAEASRLESLVQQARDKGVGRVRRRAQSR
jgi:DNA-binding PadR family transcriptional regulator